MIKFSILLISFLCFNSSINTTVIDDVRVVYHQLASDKNLCNELINSLEKTKNNSATHLAYLGSLQAIRANHVMNPINKLSTFNKGKRNIEMAIKMEPNNAEIRFIRLSIQKNIPAILGYKSNIKEDLEFVKKNQHQISSPVLLRNIELILKE